MGKLPSFIRQKCSSCGKLSCCSCSKICRAEQTSNTFSGSSCTTVSPTCPELMTSSYNSQKYSFNHPVGSNNRVNNIDNNNFNQGFSGGNALTIENTNFVSPSSVSGHQKIDILSRDIRDTGPNTNFYNKTTAPSLKTQISTAVKPLPIPEEPSQYASTSSISFEDIVEQRNHGQLPHVRESDVDDEEYIGNADYLPGDPNSVNNSLRSKDTKDTGSNTYKEASTQPENTTVILETDTDKMEVTSDARTNQRRLSLATTRRHRRYQNILTFICAFFILIGVIIIYVLVRKLQIHCENRSWTCGECISGYSEDLDQKCIPKYVCVCDHGKMFNSTECEQSSLVYLASFKSNNTTVSNLLANETKDSTNPSPKMKLSGVFQKCKSCHHGYKLIDDDCIPKLCQCTGGVGKAEGYCFNEQKHMCKEHGCFEGWIYNPLTELCVILGDYEKVVMEQTTRRMEDLHSTQPLPVTTTIDVALVTEGTTKPDISESTTIETTSTDSNIINLGGMFGIDGKVKIQVGPDLPINKKPITTTKDPDLLTGHPDDLDLAINPVSDRINLLGHYGITGEVLIKALDHEFRTTTELPERKVVSGPELFMDEDGNLTNLKVGSFDFIGDTADDNKIKQDNTEKTDSLEPNEENFFAPLITTVSAEIELSTQSTQDETTLQIPTTPTPDTTQSIIYVDCICKNGTAASQCPEIYGPYQCDFCNENFSLIQTQLGRHCIYDFGHFDDYYGQDTFDVDYTTEVNREMELDPIRPKITTQEIYLLDKEDEESLTTETFDPLLALENYTEADIVTTPVTCEDCKLPSTTKSPLDDVVTMAPEEEEHFYTYEIDPDYNGEQVNKNPLIDYTYESTTKKSPMTTTVAETTSKTSTQTPIKIPVPDESSLPNIFQEQTINCDKKHYKVNGFCLPETDLNSKNRPDLCRTMPKKVLGTYFNGEKYTKNHCSGGNAYWPRSSLNRRCYHPRKDSQIYSGKNLTQYSYEIREEAIRQDCNMLRILTHSVLSVPCGYELANKWPEITCVYLCSGSMRYIREWGARDKISLIKDLSESLLLYPDLSSPSQQHSSARPIK